MIDDINNDDKEQIKELISDTLLDLSSNISYLNYHDYDFDKYIKNLVYESISDVIDEDNYNSIYDSNIEELYLKNNIIKRSYKVYFNENTVDNHEQINKLKNCPQPEQRTDEWYIFRKQHITGSNCWKIFGSEKTQNQLYYEKLKPDDNDNNINQFNSLNDNTPFQWGHKYEPLSVKLYEYYNDVKVEEFGCIPHETIPFLAASPDGIVTSNKLNGRMIEIKNVVSREITKVPKMEYYIQMQIQMEVCDLDHCDFVETKFVEYDNEEEFKKDKYKIEKGLILVFIKNNEEMIFEYSPLFCNKEEELNDFVENCYKKYELEGDWLENSKIKWFKNIYWKLEIFSNVYVPRNKLWFKEAYPKLKEFWDTIEKEKLINDSYLKYKPTKRGEQQKKIPIINQIIDLNEL